MLIFKKDQKSAEGGKDNKSEERKSTGCRRANRFWIPLLNFY